VPLSLEGGGGLSLFSRRRLQLRSAPFSVVHDVVAAASGPDLPPLPSAAKEERRGGAEKEP
jgi:hypothetical protein